MAENKLITIMDLPNKHRPRPPARSQPDRDNKANTTKPV